MNDYKWTNIKIALLGATTVGKTSLAKMLANEDKDNDNDYIPSIGVDIKVDYIHDKKIKIIIFDLAGLERFQSIVESYIKTSDYILFCFASNNIESFFHMKKLYKYYMSKNYLDDKHLLIISTKSDKEDKEVDYGSDYAEKIGIPFLELLLRIN